MIYIYPLLGILDLLLDILVYVVGVHGIAGNAVLLVHSPSFGMVALSCTRCPHNATRLCFALLHVDSFSGQPLCKTDMKVYIIQPWLSG